MKLGFSKGSSDLAFEKIGFGTWGLGGGAYGDISEEIALDLIFYAFRKGIRLFDTSPLYGSGRSEKILGKASAELGRERITVITKAGLFMKGDVEFRDFENSALKQSVIDSLARLKSEYVDVLLLHSPSIKEIEDGLLENYGLSELIRSKSIVKFGVSLKSPKDFDFVSSNKRISAIEFNFSLMDQRCEETDIVHTDRRSYLRIARTPYNFGFLTNTPPPLTPPSRVNNHLGNWPQEQFDRWHSFREVWQEVANDNNLDIGTLSLAFALSSPFVDAVIPGFMDRKHVDEAVETCRKGLLNEESYIFLKNVYLDHAKFHKIN